LVTFVFTDIEGSTRLFRRVGDRYPSLLERHREILRAAWSAQGGCEVRTEGDAFFVAFADASAAVAACAQAQRDLANERWPADAVLRVRMGLHSGLAAPRGEDYIALAVHQAARVVDAGNGGQIVLSVDTARQVEPSDGLAVTSLGLYRVRDFDEPVELFQITGIGLSSDFPPLRVLPAERHNLVPLPTTIVGRDREIARLIELVETSRLVSVVGPGGLGKTRLVTEYGLRRAEDWEHGVWFVDLAPIDDPARLPVALAAAVGAPTTEAQDPRAGVFEFLRDRRALLIADNCEHLTASVARLVDQLLGECPAIHVLATSREPLGLEAERVWRLPPLSVDEAAVRLFCDRAGLTHELDPVTRANVVELCRVLDGLPLAIELAAARCDVLDPPEILARLGRSGLLRSHDPTVTTRQRSLEDTLEWSYHLLGTDEQSAFRRLGVFASGFQLDAATAAISAEGIHAYDAPELVWSLVAKSLVLSEPAAGSTRYRMLETIRGFAARRLDRGGELRSVSLHLARFYLDAFGPQLQKLGVDQVTERSVEIDNMRILIPIVAEHDAETAQMLACTVTLDRRRASPALGVEEGRRFLDELTAETPGRVALIEAVGRLAIDRGLIDEAADLYENAKLLAAEVGEPRWMEGRIDQQLGVVALHHGDPDRARSIALSGLSLTPGPRGRTLLLNLLGQAAVERGAYDEAREAMQAVADQRADLGDVEALGVDLGNLAEIEMRAGNYPTAARRQLESLAIATQTGSLRDVTSAQIVAARLASMTGEWSSAVRLQSAADTAMSAIGLSLFPTDRALCDALLASARENLGPTLFQQEIDAGTSNPLVEATGEAKRILTLVADAGLTI
jgi:predicted ATPase/class 3 adenylate cyclase